MKPKVLSPEESSTSYDTQLGIPPLLNEGAHSHLRFSSTFQGSLLIPYFPPIVCILSSSRRCLHWVHLCRWALYSWKPGQACNSQEEAGREVLLLLCRTDPVPIRAAGANRPDTKFRHRRAGPGSRSVPSRPGAAAGPPLAPQPAQPGAAQPHNGGGAPAVTAARARPQVSGTVSRPPGSARPEAPGKTRWGEPALPGGTGEGATGPAGPRRPGHGGAATADRRRKALPFPLTAPHTRPPLSAHPQARPGTEGKAGGNAGWAQTATLRRRDGDGPLAAAAAGSDPVAPTTPLGRAGAAHSPLARRPRSRDPPAAPGAWRQQRPQRPRPGPAAPPRARPAPSATRSCSPAQAWRRLLAGSAHWLPRRVTSGALPAPLARTRVCTHTARQSAGPGPGGRGGRAWPARTRGHRLSLAARAGRCQATGSIPARAPGGRTCPGGAQVPRAVRSLQTHKYRNIYGLYLHTARGAALAAAAGRAAYLRGAAGAGPGMQSSAPPRARRRGRCRNVRPRRGSRRQSEAGASRAPGPAPAALPLRTKAPGPTKRGGAGEQRPRPRTSALPEPGAAAAETQALLGSLEKP